MEYRLDYLEINKASWDKRTEIHLTSTFYDVPGFVAGNSSLNEIELNDIGNVAGKSLLHLQCHFGLDTLSWARLGAQVTGVDLSSKAIENAQQLCQQLNSNLPDKDKLAANFICDDVYHFGQSNKQQFDIVFTSYGAICWLPDIQKWADIVAQSLKPGGLFYIAEFHPFYDIFSGYSYFHQTAPDIEQEASYTENKGDQTTTTATWCHPISDVVNALIKAGITIQVINEYPYSPYNCFEDMEERESGKFYLKHKEQDIPLIYTIKGVKS